MKAFSTWPFRGRKLPWRKGEGRSMIRKISFLFGATTVFCVYVYNTKKSFTTSHDALWNLMATTDYIESYFGQCPGRMSSDRWLLATRYGNIQEELNDDDDDVIRHISLFYTATTSNDLLASLFGQTLCYPQSQFRNVTVPSISLLSKESLSDGDSTSSSTRDRIIRQWAVKLIYLSIYYHQHKYAIPEAKQRYHNTPKDDEGSNNCLSQHHISSKYGVGRYDFECPGAKYLVMPLGGNGLGANVRGGMVPAMMLGLMTDRVVLFLNDIPTPINATSDYINMAWPLASCARKDYQCFFWPVSPCALTEDDILTDTYYLNVSESRKLVKRNEIPSYVDHYKVWVWQTTFQPIPKFHAPSAGKLYEMAQQLIQTTHLFRGHDPELLNRAVESILVDDGDRNVYNFAASTLKVQHTITMYMLRPHPQVAQKLDSILMDIIPPNYNPEYSIGLPVRASDKCDSESECLSFRQHMTVTGEMWGKHLNRTTGGWNNTGPDSHPELRWQPTVVFTTEATSMMEEQKEFVTTNQTVSRYPQFHFQYMTNHHDVTPDSGFIRHVDVTTNDADAIMISALSSLKAQLLPRLSIGNCCSNFHILLNDFLSEGCGAASINTFHCIQESDDPLLVVCCGWHHDCHDRKEQLLLEMNATNVLL